MTDYSFQDWCELHFPSSSMLAGILAAKANLVHTNNWQELRRSTETVDVTAQEVWEVTAQAFKLFFPDHVQAIDRMRRECVTDFCSMDIFENAPHTIDRGVGLYPVVNLNFQHRLSDMVDVAHEFGHAFQLSFRKVKFVPPAVREVAAFLSELILLRHFANCSHEYSMGIQSVWEHQNQIYLGTDLKRLLKATSNPSTPYKYRFNYPPARVAAILLDKTASAPELWSVFTGEWRFDECAITPN